MADFLSGAGTGATVGSAFGPLGTGIGAGVGALVGGIGDLLGTNSANKQNMKLQKQQQDFNVQLWNMQNAYNTPEAQKQRLLAAGLNPWQMTNVANPSGSANTAPQSVAPAQVQPLNYGNAIISGLSNMMQMMTTISQADKARADAELARQNAQNVHVMTPAELGLTLANTKQSVAAEGELQSRAGLNDNQAALVDQQDKLLYFETSLRQKYGDKLDQAQLDNITQSTKESAEHVNLMVALGKLTKAQAAAALASAVESYASANHLNADTAQIKAMTEPLVQNVKANTLNSLSAVPKNFAETKNIQKQTENDNMTAKQRAVTNFLGNTISLGTGAWLNNFSKPKPLPTKTIRVNRVSHYNSEGHLTNESAYDYGEY